MDESEKKTTIKYFGTLYSGLKKRICLKSEEGLSEAKKYLREAMATRGPEVSTRKKVIINVVNRQLNLGDEKNYYE